MRKSTLKLLLVVLCITTLAATWLCRMAVRDLAFERAQVRELQSRYNAALDYARRIREEDIGAPETGGDERLSAEERRYYQRRVQRLEERIAFLETAAATVRARRRDADDMSIAENEIQAAATAVEHLLTVLINPELHELLRLRMLAKIEQDYGSLLSFFDYDAPSEDTLLALLLEKEWTAMQSGLLQMQTDLDPELRANAVAALLADRDDLLMALYDFIGAEDYAVYEAYENTQPERMQVIRLRQLLTRQGIPLNPDQEHALILALNEERTALDDAMLPGIPGDNSDIPPLPGESLEADLQILSNHYQRVIVRAAAILSEDQMELFVAITATQHAAREAALRHNQTRLLAQPW